MVIVIFLLRRLVFVLAVFYSTGSPALQAILFVVFSMLALTLLLAKRPYMSRVYNILETFNEFVVLTIGYLILALTETNISVETRG